MSQPQLLMREIPLKVVATSDGRYLLSVALEQNTAGGGDASAANQATQITAEQAIQALITALSKSEDAAHASGDQGVMMLAVRKDTAAALAGTDSDYIPLIVDSNGRLHVVAPGTTNAGAAAKTADYDSGAGTDTVTMFGLALPASGGAVSAPGDTSNGLDVDVTRIIPGTAATALGKAEDAAHSDGDTGVMLLAVRKDSAAALAGADGDYIPLIVDASGRLWTATQGTVAAGAADSGNPLKIGGKYNATLPTLTDGQRGDLQMDAKGRAIVRRARAITGTHSNVAGNAASVTILAANADRIGASIYNDSTAILYLDTSGGTASSSNYTIQIAPSGYFEVPFDYTGLITGIWAAANGNARVVEYT